MSCEFALFVAVIAKVAIWLIGNNIIKLFINSLHNSIFKYIFFQHCQSKTANLSFMC